MYFVSTSWENITLTPVGGSSCAFWSPAHLIPYQLVFYQRSYAFIFVKLPDKASSGV